MAVVPAAVLDASTGGFVSCLQGQGPLAPGEAYCENPQPCLEGQGPLAPGQSYCVPPSDVSFSNDGQFCASLDFPWVGQRSGGACVPAIAVPAPWGTVITFGVATLLVLQLFKGRRR